MLLRVGRGLGYPLASVPSAANGQLIVIETGLVAGAAVGTKGAIGGVSPPPPFWQLQRVDAQAIGDVLWIRCRINSGTAFGTITTARLLRAGIAAGCANVRADNVITLRRSITAGVATGEKYLSDEEQLILMLEAA